MLNVPNRLTLAQPRAVPPILNQAEQRARGGRQYTSYAVMFSPMQITRCSFGVQGVA